MQADVFRNVAAAADAAPTTTNRLHARAGARDADASVEQSGASAALLSELLAAGDALLPEERVLALIHLKEVEQRLILDAEANACSTPAATATAQRNDRSAQQLAGRARRESAAPGRARRGARQARRHHQHRTIDSGTRKWSRSTVSHERSAAARTHPVGRRRPGPAAPAEHSLARRALRRRGRRERGRSARRAVAFPAGSRHHATCAWTTWTASSC